MFFVVGGMTLAGMSSPWIARVLVMRYRPAFPAAHSATSARFIQAAALPMSGFCAVTPNLAVTWGMPRQPFGGLAGLVRLCSAMKAALCANVPGGMMVNRWALTR